MRELQDGRLCNIEVVEEEGIVGSRKKIYCRVSERTGECPKSENKYLFDENCLVIPAEEKAPKNYYVVPAKDYEPVRSEK